MAATDSQRNSTTTERCLLTGGCDPGTFPLGIAPALHQRHGPGPSRRGTGAVSSTWALPQAASSSEVRFRVLLWSTRIPGPFVVDTVAFEM